MRARTLEADVGLDDEANALLLHAGRQRVEVVHAQRQAEVRHLSCVRQLLQMLGSVEVWNPATPIVHGDIDSHHDICLHDCNGSI